MKSGTGGTHGRRRLIALLGIAALAVVAIANVGVHAFGHHAKVTANPRAAAYRAQREPDGKAQSPQGYLGLKETSGRKVTRKMVLRAARQARKVTTGQTAPWQFVGPTNIGGRVDDLALDTTTTPSTVYAAVTSGGVWKSTNNGVSYTPVWPDNLPQSIGALARGSNGAMYAGTGESNPSGGGVTIMGDGLYKSTDNGATWTDLGFHDSGAFGRIAVNPANPDEVWAAATGSLQWDSTQRGLYHSTDGGQTWALSIGPGMASCLNCNIKTGAIDVQVDPVNPNIILASMWDRYRNSGSFFYGGIGSGLYRSTDDGATWTRLNNTNITGSLCNWDNNDANGTTHTVPATGLDPEDRTATNDGGLGRIGIAWSSPTAIDPQANRVYIVTAGANGPDKGFYISDDAGATWHCGGARAGTQNAGYEWVFGRQWVDPANEAHIFDADVSLRVSTNSGSSWSNSGGPHSDHHAQIWDTQIPNRVYNGDDGGVYFSPTNGNSNTWTHATNEAWNQPYHIAVSQQDTNRLMLGLQDQGCVRTWRPGVPNADLTQWNSTAGCGDGHWVLINPTNQLQYFGCSQPTPPTINCQRVTDTAVSGATTSTSSSFTGNPGWGSNARITTDTPIAIDPADPAYVYTGGVSVVRSPNGAVTGTWALLSNPTPLTEPQTQTSPPSLPGPIPQNQINVDTFYANEYGSVTFIAPAKSTGTATTPCTTVYVGTDTGLLWKTTDAVVGNTYNSATPVHWTQLGAGVLPQRWVTGIQVDPADADHVIVSFSAYKDGDRGVNVWESKDGGATWANISRNLPNAPVWMITFDKAHGLVYVSSDFGVYSLYDTNPSANWLRVGTGMPNAPVLDTKLSGDGGTVFASNYGRGVYKVAAPTDTDAPTTTESAAPPAAGTGWFTSTPTITLTATDGDGSGVASIQYRLDGGALTTYTAPFPVTDGNHSLDYFSTDVLGNVETTHTIAVKVDTVAPVTGSALSPAAPTGANGWYIVPVQVTLSPTDATSGVAETHYTIDGGASQTYSAPFTISADGTHPVQFASSDVAGNNETAKSITVKVDVNDPVSTLTITPGPHNGWYASPTVTLAAGDGSGSGVAHTDYNLDNHGWTPYTTALSGFSTGNHFIQYRSTDNAGRVETTHLFAFKVDASGPKVTITTPADGESFPLNKIVTAKFKCAAEPATESGLDTCVGTVANGANLDTSTIGTHTFTVTGTDKAGNHTVVTHHYQVTYTWNGFFSVANSETSTLNLVHAGDLIKVGFGLNGDRGLNVFAAGYPKVVAVPCPNGWALRSIPAGGAGTTSGLSYGVASGHYTYGWQTSAGQAGTCAEFQIVLNDGTTAVHKATFMFFS